jgi:hypothetical protein
MSSARDEIFRRMRLSLGVAGTEAPRRAARRFRQTLIDGGAA